MSYDGCMQKEATQIHRVTDAERDILIAQREEAFERTPYALERAFLSVIRRGDLEELAGLANDLAANGMPPAGNLSRSDLRQAQYLGVSLITLATRASVEEGVPQPEAYSLSDECILRIDRLREADAVLREMLVIMERFTARVAAYKRRYSRLIKRAMDYISSHLHGDVSLAAVARHCGASPSYLSRQFHMETGTALHAYILAEKLEEARLLLDTRDMPCAEVAHLLNFSSQSHFIACYKKKYGQTPGKYRRGAAAPPVAGAHSAAL